MSRNGTCRRRPLAREAGVVLAVAAVLALVAFGAQRLLLPREKIPSDITATLDDGLGSLLRDQVKATHTILDVPAVTDDLGRIVDRLHDALPEPRPHITLLVVQSREINAFTLPGDTICVDTGLIRALSSPQEMAAVLGHELSHAVNRDPLTMLARRMGTAALLSVVSGGQGGQLLANLAQTMVDVRYGRQAEDRADEFSVRLLARAGIPPDSFAQALVRIKDSAPHEPELLKYLDPHSPIDQRIAHARDLARRQSYTARPLGIDWSAAVKALPGT